MIVAGERPGIVAHEFPASSSSGVQADGRELFSEPRACALPHRAPRHALGALVVRRQRREFTQIADDTRSVRHFCHYTRLDRRHKDTWERSTSGG